MNRRFFFLVCVLVLGVLLVFQPGWSKVALAASQPDLVWRTIETPHFRITYDTEEEAAARHVADLCEDIYTRLSPAVGWSPGEKTEILLTDTSDSANGSANVLPFNAIRLYLTAPDDLSPLGDIDDWYLELVTHEFTHILHIDHTVGLPALGNKILGKTFAPNQVAPRWLLEGLAVYEESSKTSGGRLRSSMWNMWMRADVLEGTVAGLDVMSNSDSVRRWPQGNLKYLYGSYLMQWVAETYGEQSIRAFIDDYGSQVIPFAVNRSIRRATGRTFEEIYPAWLGTLQREFEAQANQIRARGLREGIRLTHTGQQPQHPRWIPKGTWPGDEGDALFYVDDGQTRGGLYRIPLLRDERGVVVGGREKDRELMVRTSSTAAATFTPDGTLVFNSGDTFRNLYYYNDLFSLPRGVKSPSGMEEGLRTRLTEGFRALDPDVSPDGRRVVFTTNHRGTTYLQVADLRGGTLANLHTLVRSGEFEQAYTPRWSPDGTHVAYSSWRAGGYRDIRLVDVKDGTYVEITHDRAIDGDPSFSKDGRWLLFHSDRTGVTNVYAYELATGALRQVTNVINGAFQPELSPDGKTLLYMGYTHMGLDLYAMEFDPARFLDAPPYEDDRPPPPAPPAHHDWDDKPYNPLETLRPRAYTASIQPGNFGQMATIGVSGSDIVGHHGFQLSLTDEFNRPDLQGGLTYWYGRLPVDLGFSVYRAISPNGGLSIGSYNPTIIVEQIGASTSMSYSLPRAFDSQSFSATYNYARIGANFNAPASAYDPYGLPSYPTRGMVGYMSLNWSYSNAEGYLHSIGPERGISVGAGFNLSDPALGGDFSGYQATLQLANYWLMPWLKHHALALHASLGTSGGGFPGLGAFYVGGYVDESAITSIRQSVVQTSVLLRGYAPVTEVGQSVALFNAEYRFPIIELERGISTLPVFLSRISGAAYTDVGSAFNSPSTALFKVGSGGELWFDLTFSYVVGLTFRAGLEHGWSNQGIDKAYFIAVAAF